MLVQCDEFDSKLGEPSFQIPFFSFNNNYIIGIFEEVINRSTQIFTGIQRILHINFSMNVIQQFE